ncbi:hypothetical protein MG293_007537 [Ovis ammon polii]|uniref:Uncharacterized protein n=1 Tax=Ovis ammon polii TaxID=230172 RepID=A0AAD4YBW7_OVIAM|nr:hypothetical protein MG293_007537 [Ovis ammon polii]
MVPQGEAQTLRWLQGGHPADGEAGEEEAQDAYVLQPEVQPDWRGRDSQRPERDQCLTWAWEWGIGKKRRTNKTPEQGELPRKTMPHLGPVEKTDNMYTILWQEQQYKKLWELWWVSTSHPAAAPQTRVKDQCFRTGEELA